MNANRRVYKYLIRPVSRSIVIPVELPIEAKVLTIGEQKDDIYLWAEVDVEAEIETTYLMGVPTGGEPPKAGNSHFLSTVFIYEFVLHFYQLSEEYAKEIIASEEGKVLGE